MSEGAYGNYVDYTKWTQEQYNEWAAANVCQHGELVMMCATCWEIFREERRPKYPKFRVSSLVEIGPNHSDIAFEEGTQMVVTKVKPFDTGVRDTFLYTLKFEYTGSGNTGITSLEEKYLVWSGLL